MIGAWIAALRNLSPKRIDKQKSLLFGIEEKAYAKGTSIKDASGGDQEVGTSEIVFRMREQIW